MPVVPIADVHDVVTVLWILVKSVILSRSPTHLILAEQLVLYPDVVMALLILLMENNATVAWNALQPVLFFVVTELLMPLLVRSVMKVHTMAKVLAAQIVLVFAVVISELMPILESNVMMLLLPVEIASWSAETAFLILVRNATMDLTTATLNLELAEPAANFPHAVIQWLTPMRSVMLEPETPTPKINVEPVAKFLAVEMVSWILVKLVMMATDWMATSAHLFANWSVEMELSMKGSNATLGLWMPMPLEPADPLAPFLNAVMELLTPESNATTELLMLLDPTLVDQTAQFHFVEMVWLIMLLVRFAIKDPATLSLPSMAALLLVLPTLAVNPFILMLRWTPLPSFPPALVLLPTKDRRTLLHAKTLIGMCSPPPNPSALASYPNSVKSWQEILVVYKPEMAERSLCWRWPPNVVMESLKEMKNVTMVPATVTQQQMPADGIVVAHIAVTGCEMMVKFAMELLTAGRTANSLVLFRRPSLFSSQ
jgi:hypothetical protein